MKHPDLFKDCFTAHGGHIFTDYFWDQQLKEEQGTLEDIRDFIKYELFEIDDLQRLQEHEEFYTSEEYPADYALFQIIKTSTDPTQVIKAWNRHYSHNAESHGTVFAMLVGQDHTDLLDSLLEELGTIGWDT